MKFFNIGLFFKKYFIKFVRNITKSLRLQLLLLTTFALLISLLNFFVLSKFISHTFFIRSYTITDENYHDFNIQELRNELSLLNNKNSNELEQNKTLTNLLTKFSSRSKIYLTGFDGKVVYSSNNTYIKEIDINNIISVISIKNDDSKNYISLYPIKIKSANYFLIYEANLRDTIETHYAVGESYGISAVVSFLIFIAIFLLGTKNKIKYIEYISFSLSKISTGDLNHSIEVKGFDELSSLATNINQMQLELKEKIEKERESEKTKNELISNISHDLRTPLTSVLGYISLILDKGYELPYEVKSYLDIAHGNIKKLKTLIDDLFTFTTVSNPSLVLNEATISLNDIIHQLIFELSPIYEEKTINIVDTMSKEKLLITADGEKLSRVFENLLVNAIKYSPDGETVTICSEINDDCFIIKISNICNTLSQDDLDKLYDRFYRSDQSRNSKTGGSGLGLAIAKSIVSLHNGDIWATLKDNKVTFNVKLFR